MFFKKDKTQAIIHKEVATPKGAFAPLPKELLFVILSFTDSHSLHQLARSSTYFKKFIEESPHPIYLQIGEEMRAMTYKELQTFRRQQATLFAVKQLQKKQDEITASSKRIKTKEYCIDSHWDNALERATITPEEKAGTICCCIGGLVGGVLVSVFTGWSCLATTSIAMCVAGSSPLIASRTARCICGVCVECDKNALKQQEEEFHKSSLQMKK